MDVRRRRRAVSLSVLTRADACHLYIFWGGGWVGRVRCGECKCSSVMQSRLFVLYALFLVNIVKLRQEKRCASETGVDMLVLFLCVEAVFLMGFIH